MDKKLMRIVGGVLLAIGLFLFLSNMRVTSFSFSRMSGAGVIMLLLGVAFILSIIKPNKIYYVAMAVLGIVLIVTVIINMRIYLLSMNMFKWLGIAVCMFGGLGLLIKGCTKD